MFILNYVRHHAALPEVCHFQGGCWWWYLLWAGHGGEAAFVGQCSEWLNYELTLFIVFLIIELYPSFVILDVILEFIFNKNKMFNGLFLLFHIVNNLSLGGLVTLHEIVIRGQLVKNGGEFGKEINLGNIVDIDLFFKFHIF